jgi:hypothetical protein
MMPRDVGPQRTYIVDKPDWPRTPAFLRLCVADDAEILRREHARPAHHVACAANTLAVLMV